MQLYEETLLNAVQSRYPALKPEKLQAFVLWCLSEAQTLDDRPDFLQAIEQKLPTDIQACYEILTQLEVEDLIGYTLVNEFGSRLINSKSLPRFIHSVLGKI